MREAVLHSWESALRRSSAGGLGLALVLACACGDDASGEDAATAGSSTTGDEDATTTGATMTGATTTDATTTDATTGEPLDIWEGCLAYCAGAVACKFKEDEATCHDLCMQEYATGGACADANAAWVSCIAGLSCAEQAKAHEGVQDPDLCPAQLVAAGEACGFDPCLAIPLPQEDGDGCQLSQLCPAEPPQSVWCDAESCVCFEDGAEVGSCPSRGVCAGFDGDAGALEFIDFARACCGF